MSDTPLKPQLKMLRPDLEGLPELQLPAGYEARSFRPGDGPAWSAIIGESFQKSAGDFPFDRFMRADVAFRPARVWFITHAGEPVATASAYIQPEYMPAAGMIHYVGARAGHEGKKLGYWVTLTALHRMVAEGWTRAWLATDDFRLPAIKTYLNLGFVPLLVDENQRARWRDVFASLKLPELADRHAAILAGPLYQAPAAPADDYDYAARVHVRRRRHEDRRPGRPSLGEADCLADESLYKGSALGSARVEPDTVPAGGQMAFRLIFRVGPAHLTAGTQVLIHIGGQGWLGTPPQTKDPAAPGYVTAQGPAHAGVETLGFGFAVTRGELREGDEVRLEVGRETGFTWTPLAGRKELKVMVVEPGEPCRRLPEPVVIRVQPGPAARAEVLLPATARPGEPVEARLTIRDAFDNPVPLDGHARFIHSGGETIAPLVRGRALAGLGAMPGTPLRVTAAAGGLAPGRANVCVPSDDFQLFIGDLHVHDFTCPASGNPAEVYAWARDEKRLDFASVAVQNHAYLDNDKWTLNKHMAEAFLDEGRFVTFPAFEWQHSHYGDKVVHYLGGDQPYLPVDDRRTNLPCKLYEALRGSDALVISHHPGYALDLHVPGTDWDAMETDVDRLVELWSMHGSSEGRDPADRPLLGPRREAGVLEALRRGLRIGFVAGSDTHSGRPGGSAREPRPYWGGLAAVWARALTRRGLFEALRARRTYALTQARIVLRFEVNGGFMGAELPAADTARNRVAAWAADAIAAVEIFRNAALFKTFTPGTDACDLTFEDRTGGPACYHCRVIQADGNLAVASPVWVG
jgi:mycothiol synthase